LLEIIENYTLYRIRRFGHKCTKNCLATEVHPEPRAGGTHRFPKPLSWIYGPYF